MTLMNDDGVISFLHMNFKLVSIVYKKFLDCQRRCLYCGLDDSGLRYNNLCCKNNFLAGFNLVIYIEIIPNNN